MNYDQSRACFPLTRKQKWNRGDPALYSGQVWGHLNWRMGLPALLGGNLGCWIFNSPYIAQFMGCVIGRIHYGIKVVFCFRHFAVYHYNIIQECSQALEICKCLWSLSWENRDFVFIIIVQFIMRANSRIRFGLQIVFVCCTLHHLIINIVQTYLMTLNL